MVRLADLNPREPGSSTPPDAGHVPVREGPIPGVRTRGNWWPWYTRLILITLAAALGLFIPGLWTIPPVDRDESRFAQASRQMLESVTLPESQRDVRVGERGVPLGLHSGGWAVPMFGETARLNKPPLIYWLQASSAWVFSRGEPARDAIWMYRVPSVVCAMLSVLGVGLLGRSMFGGGTGHLAALLLAVSPMMIWDAHQARSDQLLTFATLLTMGALWAIWSRRARATTALGDLARASAFWMALGVGVLSKGPITPLVAGLTVVALCVVAGVRTGGGSGGRSWLWRLQPWVGVVVVSAVVSPWLFAIDRAIGLREYWAIVYEEFVVRGASGSREGHFAPPGFHLVLAAVLLWPGSLVLIEAVRAAWRGRARVGRAIASGAQATAIATPAMSAATSMTPDAAGARLASWRRWVGRWLLPIAGRDAEVFLVAWLVPAWVVFELSPAKLPHYVMPLYPAACLLCARYLISMGSGVARAESPTPGPRAQRLNIGQWVWLVIGLSGAVLCVLGAAVCLTLTTLPRVQQVGLAGTLMIFAIASVWLHAKLAPALRRGHIGVIAVVAYALSALLVIGPLQIAGGWVLPGARTARLFAPLESAYRGARLAPGVSPPMASVYHEDSVVFWSRGRVERLHTSKIVAWLAAHPDGAAIIDERQLDEARALGFASILSEAGENSTMPKGQRATVLHVVIGPRLGQSMMPAHVEGHRP